MRSTLKFFKFVVFVYALLLLTACTTMPTEDSAQETTESLSKKEQDVNDKATNEEVAPPKKAQKPIVNNAQKAPAAVSSLLNRAEKQMNEGSLSSANSSLERAIRIAPRYPESYYRLALLRYQQKQYKQARSLAQKSISLGATGSLRKQAVKLIEDINSQ